MGYNSLKVNLNILLLCVFIVNNMKDYSTDALAAQHGSVKTDNEAIHYQYFDVEEKREMKRAIIQGLGFRQTVDVRKVRKF